MTFPNPTAVLQFWIDSLNQRKLSEVAALYAPNAILLPTFSPYVLGTPEKRMRYLESLVAREGLQVSMHERTLHIAPLFESGYVASGVYRFAFEVDGEPFTFEARFTCVIDLSKPQPIQHHHSSQLPRVLG